MFLLARQAEGVTIPALCLINGRRLIKGNILTNGAIVIANGVAHPLIIHISAFTALGVHGPCAFDASVVA